jgi:hypothetical protein
MAVAWLCVLSSGARAETASPIPVVAVGVAVVATPAQRRQLEAALAEPLSRSGLELGAWSGSADLRDGFPEPGYRVLVRIVVSSQELEVLVIDPIRKRAALRLVPLPRGFDAPAREEAVYIAATSAAAVTRGEPIGSSEAEARRTFALFFPAELRPREPTAPKHATGPAPSREKPAASSSGWTLAPTDLGAGPTRWSADRWLVAGSIAGGIRRSLSAGTKLGFRGMLGGAIPARLRGEHAGLDVSLLSASWGGELVLRQPAYSLGVIAGAGYELMRATPYTEAGAELVAVPAFWSGSALLRAAARLSLGAPARLGLFVSVGADADLERTSFQVQTGSERRTVVEPALIRPWLLAGVGWEAP